MQAERKSEELNKSTAFDNKLRPTDFEGFVGQDKVRDRMPVATPNENVLQQLPSPFTIEDLRKLKGNDYADSSLYSIISRWKAEGWVEKRDKGSWVKTSQT